MISCSNYDYIEIVCLFNYPVEVTLISGQAIVGRAIDTAKNASGEECIKLEDKNGELLVILDSILSLRVLVENPHLQEVSFA